MSEEDRFSFSEEGFSLERVSFDFAFTLEFLKGNDVLDVKIEAPFFLRIDKNVLSVSPEENATTADHLVNLLHKKLFKFDAFPDGTLHITFTSGEEIEVPSSGDYEAFQITREDSLYVVSLPGGGLAVWDG